MPELSKTRTVLQRDPHAVTPVFAPALDPGEETRDYRVLMDENVWNEMDQPDIITVTIEPGDKLNDDD